MSQFKVKMMRISSLILILSAVLCSVYAQAPTSGIVNQLKVVNHKGKIVGDQLIMANISMKEGKQINILNISKDIKALYATGVYEKVDFQIKKSVKKPDTHVDVYIVLTLKPIIEAINFEGNKKFKDKRLRNKISSMVGQPMILEKIGNDLAVLNEYYEKKDLFQSVVTHRIERRESGATITFVISEKPRNKTRKVIFVGNNAMSRGDLKDAIETGVSFWGRIGFPAGFLNISELERDADRIKNAYWNIGYLDAEIDMKYVLRDEKYYITFTINEGKPYKISKIEFDGNKGFESKDLLTLFNLKVGDTYIMEEDDSFKKRIEAEYNKHGYLDMYIRKDMQANSKNQTVSLKYSITENKISHIRDFNISRNKVTQDKVIRRESAIHPGDLSDSTKINSTRRRLMNLGYFNEVSVIPKDIPGEEGLKDLDVIVSEKNTGHLSFGVGFSDVEKLTGKIELGQSNFDLSGLANIYDYKKWDTMKGGGQRITTDIAAGSQTKRFSVNFTEPWLFNKRLRYNQTFWFSETESAREFTEDSYGTQIRLTKRLPWPRWTISPSYKFAFINLKNFDTDKYSPGFIAMEEGDEFISEFGLSVSYDSRDSFIMANTGIKFSANVGLQHEGIGSYTNLHKINLNFDYYLPIFKKSVLKFSTSASRVDEFGGGDSPRMWDRHFAGGRKTIRGFDERTVGPVDILDEEPTGGKSRFLASIEYLTPIYEETVYLALFSDAGDVWGDEDGWKLDDLSSSAGVGMRIRLPIGSFSFDWGYPIHRSRDHLNKSGVFHFNIGYSF